jgi:hypothetical protein
MRHPTLDNLRTAPAHAPGPCAYYCNSGSRLAGKPYRRSRPRADPANPWNMMHARGRDATFAPCWDDDTDPVVDGGHK